jgi:hypothetical protein
MNSMLRLFLGQLLVAAVPLLAQRTWRVCCAGGPDVDYKDLPEAVAAAAPGDTILVYILGSLPSCTPTGHRYTAPTITKALRIQGFFVSASVILPPTTSPTIPTRAHWKGVLTISGIPAGQQVVISNMGNVLNAGGIAPAGLLVTDCAGSVLLEDVYLDSGGVAGMSATILRCNDVTFRGSTYRYGGVPMWIEDSQVLLSSTLVDWIFPSPTLFLGGSHPTPNPRAQPCA